MVVGVAGSWSLSAGLVANASPAFRSGVVDGGPFPFTSRTVRVNRRILHAVMPPPGYAVRYESSTMEDRRWAVRLFFSRGIECGWHVRETRRRLKREAAVMVPTLRTGVYACPFYLPYGRSKTVSLQGSTLLS